MTRKEHLHFCKQCNNKTIDATSGIICRLTGKIADFDGSCGDFQNNTVALPRRNGLNIFKTYPEKDNGVLQKEDHSGFQTHQNIGIAILGGLFSAIVSAMLWAAISVLFQYQIGFMAIGVGMLVGISVRFFGAGIEKIFGIVGASMALLGCLIGNLFAQVGFIAHEEDMPYLDVLGFLKGTDLSLLIMESFHPMDILFYAIAIAQGYRFSFRKIDDYISTRDFSPPGNRIRLPLAYLSAAFTAIFIYIFISSGNGEKTYYYDSGVILSKGTMSKGLPNEFWTYYHESGSLSAEGYFEAGSKEGDWSYYDENGILSAKEAYHNKLLHGNYLEFHSEEALADSGGYQFGRMTGLWISRYPNGRLSSKGDYKLDLPEGTWSYFYDSGELSEQGDYQKGKRAGLWSSWDEKGHEKEEIFYLSDGDLEWINFWDSQGKHLIVNGQGLYNTFYENGNLAVKGQIKNKLKEGIWNYYFEDGKPSMEIKFKGNKMEFLNSWGPDGQLQVSGGNGKYQSFYPTGELSEEGDYAAGLKEGIWESYFEDGISLMSQSHYQKGKLEGYNVLYYQDGQMIAEGKYAEDKEVGEWTWYQENGQVESRVTFINGKKSGEQLFMDEVGEILKVEKYEEGEYIETILPKEFGIRSK